ncbi:hypothetical protein E4U19_001061 [Claviceps sp. Clav32 group G5]|nr:hypothetical protein E4U19_001061 [Claviceps sp. Clav32 group G5]
MSCRRLPAVHLSVAQQRPPHHPAKIIKQEERRLEALCGGATAPFLKSRGNKFVVFCNPKPGPKRLNHAIHTSSLSVISHAFSNTLLTFH